MLWILKALRRTGTLNGDEYVEMLRDATPSAKLVACILENSNEAKSSNLPEKAMLSQGAVRDAVRYLEDEGILLEQRSLTDARTKIYSIREQVYDE